MKETSERLKSYEPLWENWYVDSWISGGEFGNVYKLKQDFFGEVNYSAVKIIPNILDNELLAKDNKNNLITEKKIQVSQEIKNMYKLREKKYLVQCIAHSIKDIYDENGDVIGFDILIQMNYYESLTKHMKENGELSISQTEKLARQIGTALKSMHDINMLHRDIKVSNIFLDQNGDFLLGDFGVSKQMETNSYSTMAGTKPYIAPEVFNTYVTKKNYSKTADIYSYGILLYYLLNNNYFPLTDEKTSYNQFEDAIIERLKGTSFKEPRNGSPELKAIVMKCCKYNSQDRYQNMNEILEALNSIPDCVEINNNLNENQIAKKLNLPVDEYKTEYADEAYTVTQIKLAETEKSTDKSPDKSMKVNTDKMISQKSKMAIISISVCIALVAAVSLLLNNNKTDNSSDNSDAVTVTHEAKVVTTINESSIDKNTTKKTKPSSKKTSNTAKTQKEISSSKSTKASSQSTINTTNEEKSEATTIVNTPAPKNESNHENTSQYSVSTSMITKSSTTAGISTEKVTTKSTTISTNLPDDPFLREINSKLSEFTNDKDTIVDYQFRADDGNFCYYYLYSENGHGYSMAYNKETKEIKFDRNY